MLVGSQKKIVKDGFRYEIGCFDRKNCTSAYIEYAAIVKRNPLNDYEDDFKSFSRTFKKFTYNLSKNIFGELKHDILRSIVVPTSTPSYHSKLTKSTLKIELTLYFIEIYKFDDRLPQLKEFANAIIDWLINYEEMEILGNLKKKKTPAVL